MQFSRSNIAVSEKPFFNTAVNSPNEEHLSQFIYKNGANGKGTK